MNSSNWCYFYRTNPLLLPYFLMIHLRFFNRFLLAGESSGSPSAASAAHSMLLLEADFCLTSVGSLRLFGALCPCPCSPGPSSTVGFCSELVITSSVIEPSIVSGGDVYGSEGSEAGNSLSTGSSETEGGDAHDEGREREGISGADEGTGAMLAIGANTRGFFNTDFLRYRSCKSETEQ